MRRLAEANQRDVAAIVKAEADPAATALKVWGESDGMASDPLLSCSSVRVRGLAIQRPAMDLSLT